MSEEKFYRHDMESTLPVGPSAVFRQFSSRKREIEYGGKILMCA
jgi:hypothetical protein